MAFRNMWVVDVPVHEPMTQRRENDLLTNVAISLFVVGVALCAPGLAATFAVDRALELRLDRAQLWSFGGLASTVTLLIFVRTAEGWLAGISRYFMFSLATVGVLLVGAHGFKSEFVLALWHAVWP